MSTLHVLRRTDSDLLHIGRSDNTADCALALSAEQAFDIEVCLSLPNMGEQLPALQRRLGAPVKGCWYAAALPAVLSAMASSLAEPPAAPASEEGLLQHTERCPIAEADKASDVMRALREKLGKDVADQLLRDAKQVTLAGADGKKRRVYKAGCARGQALRVRR